MFGYVVPHYGALAPQDLARYRAVYCGICHSLGARYGLRGRLTLTYDLTFLALILSSLYEPAECTQIRRCVPHPLHAHKAVQSSMILYAADMNAALSYHKLLDDWQDDKNLAAAAGARMLRQAYNKIQAQYPRQCKAMETSVAVISQAQHAGAAHADEAANAFGSLMASLFTYKQDRWAPLLTQMAESLGRFIYMMDAFEDRIKDARRNHPNPFAPDVSPQQARQILTVLLGECAIAFEKLPLERDLSLLRNILYAGVWTRFEVKNSRARKKEEANGSI